MDNKIPEHIGPPPMRPLRIEETPTEIAFQKAKEFDAIAGFFQETWRRKHGCKEPLLSSEGILMRYQINLCD